MQIEQKRYISPQYTRESFLRLNLTTTSNAEIWDRALNIFTDRIGGRFFNAINKLRCDENLNGFSIMALNCLLLETFYQFREGLDETEGRNKERYAQFLKDEFGDIFPSELNGKQFYSDIRCGILHSAQTKNKSRLTFGKCYAVDIDSSGVMLVDVGNFSKRMEGYYNNYLSRLRNPSEITLRQHFIDKMNFICRINEGMK